MGRVVQLGCIVCRLYHGAKDSPAEIHHLDGKTKHNAHYRVIPLCAHHHRQGDEYAPSIHSVAGKYGYSDFKERYATVEALLKVTDELLVAEMFGLDQQSWEYPQ